MSGHPPPPRPPLITLPDSGRADRRSAEYDRYFHLRRAEPELSRDTADFLAVQDAVVRDLPASGLGRREQADLLAGLALVERLLLREWLAPPPGPGPAVGPAAAPRPAETETETADGPAALYRWKLGHQLFHLQLCALNGALRQAADAAREGRWPRLAGLLQELRVLYDSATAAMCYAAAFPADCYRRDVRPTMEPPFLSPGFSGVFNREHRRTARLLGRLRRALEERPDDPAAGPPDDVRALAGELAAAQRRNHENHIRICQRFVPEGVSLLRGYLVARRAERPGGRD